MEVKITINKCNDCKYQDHTGMFDPLGPRPTCEHSKAREVRKELKIKGKPIIPHKKDPKDPKFGLKELKSIPKWCPLKNGERY